MRCYAYKPDGKYCGAAATVLDDRRGFFVCLEHSAQPIMLVAEFVRLIGGATNETDVRRLTLYNQEILVGTIEEIAAALDFALQREMHFSGPAEAVRAKSECSMLNAKVLVSMLSFFIFQFSVFSADILSTPQCSSGTSQSRPFPARSVKIMESAGQYQKTGTARPAPDGARKSAELQSCKPVSISHLFYALGQIESGENDLAIGAVGEVSRYQIRPELWRRYSSPGMVPIREADARVVVQRILLDRVRSFTARAHRPPTATEYYALWNAPAQVLGSSASMTRTVAERAERFANLFYA
jgi:hypothetical protein